MRAVTFEDQAAPIARSAYRADVALFVGHVDRLRRRHAPSPGDAGRAPGEVVARVVPVDRDAPRGAIYAWLVDEGWATGDPAADAALDELLHVPVPVDRLDTFDALFAGHDRPLGDGTCETYLRAAVRGFFAQGGRLAYVVRVGAPWPVPRTPAAADDDRALRRVRLDRLIPGMLSPARLGHEAERATWRGVWALHGLPDVSFLCVPDLPDVVRANPAPDLALPAPPPPEVAFVECTPPAPLDEDVARLRAAAGPTCDGDGYAAWAEALHLLVREIARRRPTGTLREVQVVAAVPRPADERVAAALLPQLVEVGLDRALDAGGLDSAFLQLAFPWLRTAGGARLPEHLEPPDGALCGVLARNALERGAFRSAGGRRLRGVTGVAPRLPGRDTADPSDPATLAGRVSVIGPTPSGHRVLSDVTCARGRERAAYRAAHVGRLVATVTRVLRVTGEAAAFEDNGERTWRSIRTRVADVLRGFWRAGGLAGAREADAFTVRCDRSTMSQADLDAGRLVVHVELTPAQAIQRIEVVLTRIGAAVALERAA